MKFFPALLSLALLVAPFSAQASYDSALAERLHGRILLQVEEHGEAYYVRSTDSKRYYMKDGSVAYEMMRYFSLGITNADLATIPSVSTTNEMNASSSACSTNSLANRLKGEILLQVEEHGEAWYVDPAKCRRIYMADGEEAYQIMRYLGLGITNADLEKIELGVYSSPTPEPDPTPEPTPEPEPTPDPSQDSTDDYLLRHHFTSTGDYTSAPFTLTSGEVAFVAEHIGDYNFIVKLIPVNGGTTEWIVNTIDNYYGTTYGNILAGTYYLEVDADYGEWQVGIYQ